MSFYGIIIVLDAWRRDPGGTCFKPAAPVKLPRSQISSSRDRVLIGHVYDQGPSRALGIVKNMGLSPNGEEQFLHDVFSLRRISQNLFRDTPHQAGVTAK